MNQIDIIEDLDLDKILDIVKSIHLLDKNLTTNFQGLLIEGVPKPLQFYISTNEGPGLTHGWFDVIPVVDTIIRSNLKTVSTIHGICSNSTLLIHLVCEHRTINEHGYIILDPLTSKGGLWGNIESQHDEMSNHNTLLNEIYSIIKKRSNIPPKVMKKLLKEHIVIDAKTAKSYGLVDEIV